ncbi:MAG: HAD family hydrolase [Clostridia bacterium]|nr:HAD family hydrolase [Clostridia bacterium]
MTMTLVFDYDGTLHNTAHLYGCAFRTAYGELVEQGFAQPHYYTDEYMSRYLGMTAEQMWSEFMPQLPEEIKKSTAHKIGTEMVRQVYSGGAKLYDNAEKLLDRLADSGLTMVILSNCHHDYLEAHRRFFELDRWFVGYYCAEDYKNLPKEKIFEFIKNDHPDDNYVIIGDRLSDIKVGLVNNVPTVGCVYGFGSEEELEPSTAKAGSIEQVYEAVSCLYSKPKDLTY